MKINEALSKFHRNIIEDLYEKYEEDFDEALGNDDGDLMHITIKKFKKAVKKMGVPESVINTWITDQLHPEAMPNGYGPEED
jgi:succinate dehydrogenase flavin-adding protein (antitoxin of CptAB toxin-antitoxin module)